jgi:hypothetical protein
LLCCSSLSRQQDAPVCAAAACRLLFCVVRNIDDDADSHQVCCVRSYPAFYTALRLSLAPGA